MAKDWNGVEDDADLRTMKQLSSSCGCSCRSLLRYNATAVPNHKASQVCLSACHANIVGRGRDTSHSVHRLGYKCPHPCCPRTMTTELWLPNYGHNTLPHKNGLKLTFPFIHIAPLVLAVLDICSRHRAQTASASPPSPWARMLNQFTTHLQLVLRLHGSLSHASIRLLKW
jgi:hypothetical protein